MALQGAPFLPNQTFELGEQLAITLGNRVNKRREHRKRLAFPLEQTADQLGRYRAFDLGPRSCGGVHKRTPDLSPAEKALLVQPVERRHQRCIRDARVPLVARLAHADLAASPDELHDAPLEHPETVLENLVRGLEAPEEEAAAHPEGSV